MYMKENYEIIIYYSNRLLNIVIRTRSLPRTDLLVHKYFYNLI